MKTVIFGGAGFLGSHIADKLSDDGHEVTIFDLKASPYLRGDQVMVEGDILDQQHIESVVDGCDVVYNFAGYADLDSAATRPADTARLNILGNIYLLEACKKFNIKQFVYASTIYVFSESGGFYRCSKQASESYIEEFHNKFGLNYTILRYGTLYGPRSDSRNSIYRYLSEALKDSKIEYSGSGDEIREYIFVRDAAKVSARILEEKFYNKRFVVTGHQAIPVRQMFEMIQEILKKPVKIKYSDSGESDHYKITPYSFVPKVGEKFAPELFTDMGQGLIECLGEISNGN